MPGDAAPWFVVRSIKNPRFHLDTIGGRYILLYFAGSLGGATARPVEQALLAQGAMFNGSHAVVAIVSADPADEAAATRSEQTGIKYFWDFDRNAARAYGFADEQMPFGVQPALVLLDRSLRILALKRLASDGTVEAEVFLDILRRLPAALPPSPAARQAPVLVVDRIFEPDFCRALIDYSKQNGTVDSGYMQQIGERTVGVIDYSHKRRQDCWLADETLINQARARVLRRLVPEIKKAFQFEVTRIERFLVACYDAQIGGYFRAHRDNTTAGTAHRRFAVTINLNAEEYEGGDLRFPEYGAQYYRATTGGAVVFSCSLLHEAMPVTRGERYAFVPFLYDDAGALLRQQNARFIDNQAMRLDAQRQTVPVEPQSADQQQSVGQRQPAKS
jgi:predicted 2-oxoglutarate/Fe(II)-dependent dioxygenase YbiX/peroxiredoxin